MLNISEIFGPTIQGEGITAGVPSIFIRNSACNFICGGHNGSLVGKNGVTWWCDTEKVWTKGIPYTNEQVEEFIKSTNRLEQVLKGEVHLIWTGGEPTLPGTQKNIMEFLDYMRSKHPLSNIYSEIETNGSIVVDNKLYFDHGENNFCERYIQQINCSPKLSNSGMPASMRINKEAILQILVHSKGYFKFVVNSEIDVQEMERDFIIPFRILHNRVYLMPGVDSLANLSETSRIAAELAIKYNYNMCSRLQILCWDRTTGC